jgi:hypothetical protein
VINVARAVQQSGDRRAGIVVEHAGVRHPADPGLVVGNGPGVRHDVARPHPVVGDGTLVLALTASVQVATDALMIVPALLVGDGAGVSGHITSPGPASVDQDGRRRECEWLGK